jgi:hypothetical protein
MKFLRSLAIVLCTASVLFTLPAHAAPITFTGPLSPYYLDEYNTGTIYIVQGTTVINSFEEVYGSHVGGTGGSQEAMLVVTDTIRTNAFQEGGTGGIGGQYTLSGVPTLVQYAQPAPPTSPDIAYDATSDGKFNYYLQYRGALSTQGVIRTDLDWQNPTVLFTLPTGPGDFMGIAYDSTNNSLWISGWRQSELQDYSLSGTPLASVPTTISNLSALGMDPADHTLWATLSQSGTMIQFDTSGNILQQGTIDGLPSGNFLSGEFAGVPEPSTLVMCGIALIGLARQLRKK